MRTAPGLLVVGALALGACASSTDVRSTASNDAGEQLPAVEDVEEIPSAPNAPTTVPGTRPADDGSPVLLASDLPGWDVVDPMDVPDEPTWEALDCPDMNVAWGATGRTGTRSRGTNGRASFRNTAVAFTTTQEAGDVLDAVDRVWTECTLFESDLGGSFWSEPIVMPPSTFRTSGLAIGSTAQPNWTLAFWQVGAMVVVLEVEGDEMWTFLDPLLVTLSARLDGTPTPIQTRPADELPKDPPVLTQATLPPVSLPATTVSTTTEPVPGSFPPAAEDWAEHSLARLAPAPDTLGSDWTYRGGSTTFAEPIDPTDAIEGCDAVVPKSLDGYDLTYARSESESEMQFMVGAGTAAESQTWVDALRGIAGCDLDPALFLTSFELLPAPIDGVDDVVLIVGTFDVGAGPHFVQVIGAARVDGVMIATFVVGSAAESQTVDTAAAQVVDVLTAAIARL